MQCGCIIVPAIRPHNRLEYLSILFPTIVPSNRGTFVVVNAARRGACATCGFDFIECFTTTFLRAHSWLNWVNEDDDEHDEVGLKEKPEDTRYIKKITSK